MIFKQLSYRNFLQKVPFSSLKNMRMESEEEELRACPTEHSLRSTNTHGHVSSTYFLVWL